MKIYFAGSIRGGRNDQLLYLEIIELLSQYGQVLTEHVGNRELSSYGELHLTDIDIYERDMAWLKSADIVVAEITTPSIGVGYELGWSDEKKPVLCLFRKKEGMRISAMINGNRNIQVKEYEQVSDLNQIFSQFFKSQHI